MIRDKLYLHVKEQSQIKGIEKNPQSLTAEEISRVFQVKRNTVSHYLNEMHEAGMLVKINTRPVYFFDRESLSGKYGKQLKQLLFASLSEMEDALAEIVVDKEKKDIFGDVIGSSGSLKKTIEQVKTSVLYPPKGLPILIIGPTGVGKSYLANLIYRYSVEMGVIAEEAPFTVFNCAQYYNNPELLSTNLFGYAKGTFTGANSDKEGMLEKADKGILFLDEIHRLSPEGQEKLFNFMDKGIFRRMGENHGERRADVRLIFATTADTNEYFLDTFLRRIPIVIHIPDLQERGSNEKLHFIYSFLLAESKLLGRNLTVSSKAVDMLLKYKFKGNIGEMINVIKYACAKEYSKDRTNQEIRISLSSFPENIPGSSDIEKFNSSVNQDVIITPETEMKELLASENENLNQMTYMLINIYKVFDELKSRKITKSQFEMKVSSTINLFLDYLIFKMIKPQEKDFIMNYLIQNLNGITSVSNKLYGNITFVLANYLYIKNSNELGFNENQLRLRDQIYQYIVNNYQDAYNRTNSISYIVGRDLDIQLSKEDEIFFSFYLKSLDIDPGDERIKVVLLTHGYATASSIANVANRMLKKNIFEAFDMPIEVSVKEIVNKLKNYIDNNDIQKGLIIMVDTGSLKDIFFQLQGTMKGPVAVINNASTQMALDIGNMICNNYDMELIMENVLTANHTEYRIIYPETNKKRAIITTCMTGVGTAIKIKKLLEESLPVMKDICVEAYEFSMLKSNSSLEKLFQRYEVMGVVGTDNPEIPDIRYISLEDLISGEGENLKNVFGDMFSSDALTEINMNIVRNFSLERVIHSLTILNTDNIIKQIEEAIIKLEMLMNKKFSNDLKIGLYIHISCLIERLIRQCPITNYANLENFEQCQRKFIESVKSAFSVIENMYGVNIIESEIGYIYDIITLKTQEI